MLHLGLVVPPEQPLVGVVVHIPLGLSENGSNMFALPPKRFLIFCARLKARSILSSRWLS
jgi:hypothetical protein